MNFVFSFDSETTGQPHLSTEPWPKRGGAIIPCVYKVRVQQIMADYVAEGIREQCCHPCIHIKVSDENKNNEFVLTTLCYLTYFPLNTHMLFN